MLARLFTLKDGKCMLYAKSNDLLGAHKSFADMESAIDVEFKINPKMLERILKEFPACAVDSNGIRVQTKDYSYAVILKSNS